MLISNTKFIYGWSDICFIVIFTSRTLFAYILIRPHLISHNTADNLQPNPVELRENVSIGAVKLIEKHNSNIYVSLFNPIKIKMDVNNNIIVQTPPKMTQIQDILQILIGSNKWNIYKTKHQAFWYPHHHHQLLNIIFIYSFFYHHQYDI